MKNSDHVYIFLIMCSGVFLANRIILNLSLSVLLMVSTARAK